MEWYHYFAGFWAGMFLTNFVPHFVKGMSGDLFPSPFSKPRGIGPSSPITNVWWGLFNLFVGFLLFRVAHISMDNNLSLLIFFAGIALMSSYTARHFVKKDKM